MASKSGKVGFKFSEPCPDCARLRALLREAKKLLEDAAYTSTSDEYTALELSCFELAARIAKEVEGGK